MHGRLGEEARLGDGSRGDLFWLPQRSESRATLGTLLALSLLTGAGAPLAVFFALGMFEWWRIILLVLVATLPFAVVATAIRSLRYAVDSAGVTVHHLRAKLYRWNEIEAVHVWRKRPKGFIRIGVGATMPGFYVGRFRERELGTVQVYATATEPPFIILQTRPAPVMLSPEDVEGFVAAVRRRSGRKDIVVGS